MSEQNNTSATIAAFLLGSALGVAAGLLLAPRSGKDTRRRLQRWAEELEGKGEDLIQEGRELIEESKEMMHDKTEKVKKALDQGKKIWDNVTNRS